MRDLGQSQHIFTRALLSLLQNPGNQFPQSQSYVNVVSFGGCITLLGLGEWVPSQTQTVGHCLALLLTALCGQGHSQEHMAIHRGTINGPWMDFGANRHCFKATPNLDKCFCKRRSRMLLIGISPCVWPSHRGWLLRSSF